MIKRLFQSSLFGLLGIGLSFLLTYVATRLCDYSPGACAVTRHCEECSDFVLILFVYPLVLFLLFAGTAYIGIRNQWSRLKIAKGMVLLTLCVAVVANATYTHFLVGQTKYWYDNREIQANAEYVPTFIAKEEIDVFDDEGLGAKKLFAIKQWERCALGYNDENKSRIDVECKKGIGWMDKKNLPKIIKLPNPTY